MSAAHAVGTAARGAGTGLTLASGFAAAHAAGTAATSTPGPTYVLDFGKPLMQGNADEVRASAAVRAAYLGRAA